MNRVSVRGVGFAAAAMAATSLAVGATATTDASGDVQAPLAVLGSIAGGADTAASQLTLVRAMRAHAVTVKVSRHRTAQRSAALAHAKAIRVARAERAAAARRDAARRAAEAERAARSYMRSFPSGSARAIGAQMVADRGWSSSQFMCLDSVWTHESNWRINAYNSSSGAYGIPQAAPGSRMGSVGSDWRTNPATQISWGLSYIAARYGDPCAAWSFWQSHHWY
jgi:hypothetical protein